MVSERASERAFFDVSALLFAASEALTIIWCASMSAMGEMPMPGDLLASILDVYARRRPPPSQPVGFDLSGYPDLSGYTSVHQELREQDVPRL
jgi:hypothetical protein